MALADMIGHTMTQPPTSIPQETLPGDVVDPWSPSAIPLGPPYQAPPPPVNIPPVEVPHPHKEALEVAATHQLSPEVRPMIKAMDEGYADPKYMKMRDQIREALQSGDEEGVDKLHDKLTKLIRGPQSTWDWYNENVATTGRGGKTQAARKMAGELILSELQAITGLGSGPEIPAEEALHMGLIQPGELVPGRQMQESYGVLRDGGTQSLIPNTVLTPFQKSVVGDRRTALTKGRQHTDPVGLQEFNTQLQALMGKHIEEFGAPPNKSQYADIVAIARGQFEKDPLPGGPKAKAAAKDLEKVAAEIRSTEAKTLTENTIRPHQVAETQAKTTQLLATATQAMTNASDAVRKGDLAQQQAEMERARVSLGEMKSQMQALAYTLSETDVTKEDRVKMNQMFLDLALTGTKLSKRSGLLGLDFLDMGAPNVSLTQEGTPGSRTQPINAPPAPVHTGVDPFSFAPKIPGMTQFPQPLPPLPQEKEAKQSAPISKEDYAKLRAKGLSHKQIVEYYEKEKR